MTRGSPPSSSAAPRMRATRWSSREREVFRFCRQWRLQQRNLAYPSQHPQCARCVRSRSLRRAIAAAVAHRAPPRSRSLSRTRMTTFIHTQTFTVFHCCEVRCGVAFALNDDFVKHRKRDRKSWYCPNGHSQWFPGETAEDKAQRLAGQLDIERARRPTLDGKDADPDRIAELVAALSAPAEVVPLPAGPAPASIVAGDI